MNEMTSLSSMKASTVIAHRLDDSVDYFDRILHLFDVTCVLEGPGQDVNREKEVGDPPEEQSLPDALRPHLAVSSSSLSASAAALANCCHSSAGVRTVADAHSIQFISNTRNPNNLERAKKYWESVQVLERASNGVRRVCPTPTAFSRLLTLRDSIERSSCAVLKLSEDLHTLEVRGRDDCVAAAVAMVDEAINEDELIQSHLGMSAVGTGVWSSVVGNRYGSDGCGRRTKLESEDSSYDSDYENSEPLSSPAASYKQEQELYGKHEDVSRTVSDTLRAEFAEYVGPVVRTNTIKELGDQEGNEEDVFSDPDYTSRIEFALKLGYTEKQAQVALHKLGPKPQQNELLAELIKLGACNQQKGVSGVGGLENVRGGTSEVSSAVSNMVTNSRKLDSYPADGYELRSIVIDGSNVAMSHGNKEMFSCRGIKLCVDWFKARGHKDITVFVPLWRKEASRPDAITTDQEVLWELEKERRLVFTPSRQMGGRRMACHDDRYILKLAVETDGVVVSNDNYRDLVNENPEFKKVIEERLLMYSFVNDRFMPPDDPLGRHGPSLDSFLCVQKPQEPLPRACPYGKKCTYGNKCKYYHPERGNQPHKSISDQIVEQAKINIQEVKARSTKNSDHSSPEGSRLRGTLSSPFPNTSADKPMAKRPLQRTKSLVPPSMESAPLRDVQSSTLVTITPPPPDLEPIDATGSRQNITSPTWSSQFYGDGGNHLSVAKRLSDPDSCKGFQGDGSANLHRKLQRQLTLNPVYDPRLVHMRNYMHQQQQQQQSMDGDRLGETKEHLPVARHSSAGAAEAMAASRGWGNGGGGGESLHQSVTRIASAPDTYHQWQPMHPSEIHPHYVWGPVVQHPSGANLPMSMPCPQMPTGRGGRMNVSASTCEKRNHLYYHLSSIFPKEQVRAAMEAHPEETDPQAICTAILNTFPHHR